MNTSILDTIDNEIEERKATANEADDDHYRALLENEIISLREMRALIVAWQPLTYSQYMWLTDLVATQAQIDAETARQMLSSWTSTRCS